MQCHQSVTVAPGDGARGQDTTDVPEIRSLASWLYNKEGINDQARLDHKTGSMAAAYRDVWGAEWVEVAL